MFIDGQLAVALDISPLTTGILITFSILFLVGFGVSSATLDAKGLFEWMSEKPSKSGDLKK